MDAIETTGTVQYPLLKAKIVFSMDITGVGDMPLGNVPWLLPDEDGNTLQCNTMVGVHPVPQQVVRTTNTDDTTRAEMAREDLGVMMSMY